MHELRQFIRLGPDKRGLGLVYGKIEIMRGNIFKLLGEKLFNFRENKEINASLLPMMFS